MSAQIPAPHLVLHDVLSKADLATFLTWTVENEASFVASRVHTGVDENLRRSRVLADIGPFKMPFASAVKGMYKDWIARLGMPSFDASGIELELAAHNDGAHFTRHIDTETSKGAPRAISAVYYFHREPKAFSGGALRIYPMGSEGEPDVFAEVQPTQNTMVVFPSWAPHKVMPVQCASRQFADSRFAVNCWVHAKQ